MLVLSRKSQQRIQIGDSIVVTVLEVKGRTVRLGIEAPRSIRVMRTELDADPAQSEPQQRRPPRPRSRPLGPSPDDDACYTFRAGRGLQTVACVG